ncbi:MAG: ATP-binding cassette domain-containing protein, partial [Gaiellaceae bacterium]
AQAGYVHDLPWGLDTRVGEQGMSLSGGQRQRLALARAILADPVVLVLDDATSSVDATKEHEIRAALASVMAGRTTLVIAHRPATIALADRVAVLEEGRIVETGTHAHLLAGSERYRSLLALDGAEAAAECAAASGRSCGRTSGCSSSRRRRSCSRSSSPSPAPGSSSTRSTTASAATTRARSTARRSRSSACCSCGRCSSASP